MTSTMTVSCSLRQNKGPVKATSNRQPEDSTLLKIWRQLRLESPSLPCACLLGRNKARQVHQRFAVSYRTNNHVRTGITSKLIIHHQMSGPFELICRTFMLNTAVTKAKGTNTVASLVSFATPRAFISSTYGRSCSPCMKLINARSP